MARKTLLTEGELRRFMKLASMRPLGEEKIQEMGYGQPPAARDDELDDEEMDMGPPDMGAEEAPVDELPMDDEPAMDDEPVDDEPVDDIGAEDEPEDDAMMQEDIVNEVLKRVTQRIIKEKMKRK